MRCEEFLGLYDLYLDAEAGRGELDRATFQAMRRHREICPECRAEVEGMAPLVESLRSLPVLEPPEAARRIGSPERGGAARWLAPIVSAAAAVLFAIIVLWLVPRGREPTLQFGQLQIERRGEWESIERLLPREGARCRTSEGRAGLILSRDVTVELEGNSHFTVRSPEDVYLEDGRLTAWVRPGTPFTVQTPFARVSVRGTIFSVRVRKPRGLLLEEGKEPRMKGTIQTAVIAAAVSVVVSTGTVIVHNSLAEVSVGPGEAAWVPEKGAPEVVRLADAVEDLEGALDETRASVEELRTQTEEGMEGLTAMVEEVAAAGSPPAPGAEGAGPAEAADQQALAAELAETFDTLARGGLAAYQNPRLGELAERLRTLEDGGKAFVRAELNSENGDRRFLAAALAEKLADPGLIADLERCALEDKHDIVRRMASHALGFMGNEAAGDSLARIVEEETSDAGVRLNAWYGLAMLEHPETTSSFEKILDRSGPVISANMAVETALVITKPSVLPCLRLAYERKDVSNHMKVRILHTLARAESGEYLGFVRGVANDPNADETLQKAALEALGGQ